MVVAKCREYVAYLDDNMYEAYWNHVKYGGIAIVCVTEIRTSLSE